MSKYPAPRISHLESDLPSDVVLRVDNVSKKFCRKLKQSMKYGIKDLARSLVGVSEKSNDLRDDEFWAVKDVSFELKRGECLGLIGRNGCGKTTLLRIIAGIFPPDAGEVAIRGRVGALISLGAGFHPHMTGRENVYLNGSILGLSKKEIDAQFAQIVDFAEIAEFIDAPVSTYSSGMRVRLGFAVATAVKPELLLVDEILAVGDIRFRGRCYVRIGEILKTAAVVFVTHDMNQLDRLCDSVIYLASGHAFPKSELLEGVARYEAECANHVAFDDEVANVYNPSLRITRLIIEPNEIRCGDRIRLIVDYDSCQSLRVKFIRCNLTNSIGQLVADYHSEVYESKYDIKMGRGQWIIDLGVIMLSRGLYKMSMAAYDETGKQMIFHLINALTLRVHGAMITTSITEMGHL